MEPNPPNPATTEAEISTTDETPTTKKADPSPNDVEFLKGRIRTLEQEKREEAQRNEQREAKLFEQLVVKDKQISNWDEITQGLMRGLATGQLRPDSGTMVLAKPAADAKRGVADAIVEDAMVVEQEPKAETTPQNGAASVTATRKAKTRKRTTKSSTPEKPATQQPKQFATASPQKPKWYEMPTLSRYLPRKR